MQDTEHLLLPIRRASVIFFEVQQWSNTSSIPSLRALSSGPLLQYLVVLDHEIPAHPGVSQTAHSTPSLFQATFMLKHLLLLTTTEKEKPPVFRVFALNGAQMTSHCCSAALSMKGVSRFLWYQEFVHWPLGSALLQTSWRDQMYSFIAGSCYAGGRLHEE